MVKKTRQLPGCKVGRGRWSVALVWLRKASRSLRLLFSLERSEAFIIFNRMRKQWSASKWSNRSSVCVSGCVCVRESVCGVGSFKTWPKSLPWWATWKAAKQQYQKKPTNSKRKAEAVRAPIKSIIISFNCCTTAGKAYTTCQAVDREGKRLLKEKRYFQKNIPSKYIYFVY